MFLRFQFQHSSPKLLTCLPSLNYRYWASDICKQKMVSMDKRCWASVVHMHVSNMFDMAVPTNRPSNMRTKGMFSVVWLNAWWPSNFIKHEQTWSNSNKQCGQTVKCLVTKHVWWCLITKHFPFRGSRFKVHFGPALTLDQKIKTQFFLLQSLCNHYIF